MIVKSDEACTVCEVWFPRYKDRSHDKKELTVLIPDYKINSGTRIIEVRFTKAKHLMGKKFVGWRDEIKKCPLETNGTVMCYVIPFSLLSEKEPESVLWEDIRKAGW